MSGVGFPAVNDQNFFLGVGCALTPGNVLTLNLWRGEQGPAVHVARLAFTRTHENSCGIEPHELWRNNAYCFIEEAQSFHPL